MTKPTLTHYNILNKPKKWHSDTDKKIYFSATNIYVNIYICIRLNHFNEVLKLIAFRWKKMRFQGLILLCECMSVTGNIIQIYFLLSTRLTKKMSTHDVTCNIYWYQCTLRTQKVFMQTSQGTFIHKIFVILRSGITTKIKRVYHHWRD